MAAPGMTNELYKKLSRPEKAAYWFVVSLVGGFVIYVWFLR